MSNRNMNKSEWEELFERKKAEMETIRQFIREIEVIRGAAKTAEAEIQSENGYLAQIETNFKESERLLSEIEKVHTSICENTNESDSYETLIGEIYEDLEEKQKQQEIYFKKLFGETREKENGEVEKVLGMEAKIDSFFSTRQEKMDSLLKEAEEKLIGASTSVELSMIFSTKVADYEKSGFWWSFLFFGSMMVIIGYYMYITRNNADATNFSHVWTLLLYRLPLIGFGIWFIGFIGNRRAEAKKLEEAYKHKEVMARSYVGYRRSVEELDTKDNKLLELHMENLLTAITRDSSEFLRLDGEKHPFFGLLGYFGKRNDK